MFSSRSSSSSNRSGCSSSSIYWCSPYMMNGSSHYISHMASFKICNFALKCNASQVEWFLGYLAAQEAGYIGTFAAWTKQEVRDPRHFPPHLSWHKCMPFIQVPDCRLFLPLRLLPPLLLPPLPPSTPLHTALIHFTMLLMRLLLLPPLLMRLLLLLLL